MITIRRVDRRSRPSCPCTRPSSIATLSTGRHDGRSHDPLPIANIAVAGCDPLWVGLQHGSRCGDGRARCDAPAGRDAVRQVVQRAGGSASVGPHPAGRNGKWAYGNDRYRCRRRILVAADSGWYLRLSCRWRSCQAASLAIGGGTTPCRSGRVTRPWRTGTWTNELREWSGSEFVSGWSALGRFLPVPGRRWRIVPTLPAAPPAAVASIPPLPLPLAVSSRLPVRLRKWLPLSWISSRSDRGRDCRDLRFDRRRRRELIRAIARRPLPWCHAVIRQGRTRVTSLPRIPIHPRFDTIVA